MKHIKLFEELYPVGTETVSSGRLTFKQLLENPTFQDYYEWEMNQDGFDMFKDLFGDNDSLSYEVSGDRGVIIIYWTDKSILDDLMYVVKKLGAEEVTVQKDHIRLWFD